jgi:16S rRNA (cytosine1402-N4)-methyltransferase
MYGHTPVLLNEVLSFLNPASGGRFIDATFGAGGHTRALLDRTAPDGVVLALDADASAIERGREAFRPYGFRLVLVRANFRDVVKVAGEQGFKHVDGVLADIGVSSMMLDDPLRGFSFMREGALDMRMDQSQELTAADIVNTSSERELADILYHFGEERRSRAIARSIVRSRPLLLTTDLARAVERVLGGARYGRIHPATRTFQALRIAVNDELKSLETFLDSAPAILRARGRLAVITFHSLEDRIVKNRFRGPSMSGTVLTRKVITATAEEIHLNPRARSARLRVWEKKNGD